MTPIDMKIREWCRATGEPDFKNYDTILGHVRTGLIDLNLYTFPGVKTVTVCANTLKNIDWPCGTVKVLLVTLIRNGKECNLFVDSGIAKSDSCGCNSFSEADAELDRVFNEQDYGTDVFYYDADNAKVYGPGIYKTVSIDSENRLIHINCKIYKNDKFKVTYITDGVSEGVTHIHPEAETVLEEWVFWKYFKRSDKGLSDRSRENYKQEQYRLKRFYQDLTIDDWIKAVVR